jgi:cyclopropane-fatty-acyl-phospholipid synthase
MTSFTTASHPTPEATFEARWPDVARVPATPVRGWIARRLFHRLVADLDVRVSYPDGAGRGGGSLNSPQLRLVDPQRFFARVGAGGLIGFGESYLAGEWTADDLPGVLTVFAQRVASLVPPPLQRLRDLAVHRRPNEQRGTRANAGINVAHHYDLSNELFALFLDPTMSYSSALFDEHDDLALLDVEAGDQTGLRRAQERKIDRLLDRTGVGPGTRLLEIGTGWGELALRAAARGATVRSLTLSARQREWALGRVEAAGLGERVQIDLCDYRDATGEYDAVVSVEMIEAVGYEYWAEYFRVLEDRLAPGGLIGLQAITMPDDRMLASRDTFTWIQKYVFPGGLIPSSEAIHRTLAEHTTLEVSDQLSFGADYATTLAVWRERFEGRSEQVEGLGFDETFRRLWSFYLAYSEAGFRSGYLDVSQFVIQRRAAG